MLKYDIFDEADIVGGSSNPSRHAIDYAPHDRSDDESDSREVCPEFFDWDGDAVSLPFGCSRVLVVPAVGGAA
jgi:hypothetical protein